MAAKKTKKKKIAVENLLDEIQARFDVIEGKLDTLLSKSAVLSRMVSTERDPNFKTRATVTKKFPIPQDKPPRKRKMYQVVCTQCKKNCEVPFVPRADRPVYCKTCYYNQRKGTSPRNIPDREELVAKIAETLKIDIAAPSKTKASKLKKTKSKVSETPKAKKPKTKKPKAKK